MTDAKNIRTACERYTQMEGRWCRIDDLHGGTDAMRAAREKWLPMFPGENPLQYESRLAQAVLFGALKDSIKKVVAKPFSRRVTINGLVDKRLKPIEHNADRAGASLHEVARQFFEVGVKYGLGYLLVDPPRARGDETLAQVLARGLYPAIVPIAPSKLIFWRHEKDDTGAPRLAEIRILEEDETTGKCEERVRVITAGDARKPKARATWAIYRAPRTGEGTEWVSIETGTASYREIPLIAWYANRVGLMRAEPPYQELAEQNVRHWQSGADQSNILQYARVAQPYAIGLDDEAAIEFRKAGWNRAVTTENVNAKFGFIEHSGKAIECGRQDLKDIEERMEILGMRPLIERVSGATATGVSVNQSGEMTLLQSWIADCSIALTAALKLAHVHIGADIPDDLAVSIYSDFHVSMASTQDLAWLDKSRERGDIGQKTHLFELQRRSALWAGHDIDKVVDEARVEKEHRLESGISDRLFREDRTADKSSDPNQDASNSNAAA